MSKKQQSNNQNFAVKKNLLLITIKSGKSSSYIVTFMITNVRVDALMMTLTNF